MGSERFNGLGGDGDVAGEQGAPGAVELGARPLDLPVGQVVVEGAASAGALFLDERLEVRVLLAERHEAERDVQ